MLLQEIEKLTTEIKELELTLAPKKKFAFKSRETKDAKKIPAVSSVAKVPEEVERSAKSSPELVGCKSFIDCSGDSKFMTSPEITQENQIYIQRCTNCSYAM